MTTDSTDANDTTGTDANDTDTNGAPDEPFDETYDVVVVGSGAAALTAAIGAGDEGLSVLIVESAATWGGNTALSGGGLWMPNNPLMARDGVGDSREEALRYLEACVGQVGRASSPARREAFVDGVADVVNTVEKYGMRLVRATDYPDYYPELPGGKVGRAIEFAPLDLKRLGPLAKTSGAAISLPMLTDDYWLVARAWSTPAGMVRGARLMARIAGGKALGKRLAATGAGCAGSLLQIAVNQLGAHLWLESPLEDLVLSGDRVTGVRVIRDGAPVTVRARRGVVLGSGGFEQNPEWRRKYHGIDGASSGAPSNLGHPITAAVRAGAATELMDDAWWGGSVPGAAGFGPSFMVGERSMPHSLIVDAAGDRFANESESYVDLGHHMIAHDVDGPFWMITDARHARRYLRTYAMDPKAAKALKAAGILVSAPDLATLAERIAVPAQRLSATVERFNGFARAGVDGDFGRGNSAYDRYYSDPLVHPNPNLGALEKAPFHAVQVVLGDLGTKGGVLTDVDGQALREDGTVIAGLYAAGNCSASVMGRTYPGPGSTIGPATVFGLRAARHLARN